MTPSDEVKSTPGPWMYHDRGKDYGNHLITNAAGTLAICRPIMNQTDGKPDLKMMRANAALIARAPTLMAENAALARDLADMRLLLTALCKPATAMITPTQDGQAMIMLGAPVCDTLRLKLDGSGVPTFDETLRDALAAAVNEQEEKHNG